MSLDQARQPQGRQLELPLFPNKPLQTNLLSFMDMKNKVRSPKVKEELDRMYSGSRHLQWLAESGFIQSPEVCLYFKKLGKLLTGKTFYPESVQTNLSLFMDMKKKVRNPNVKEEFDKVYASLRNLQWLANLEFIQSPEVRLYIKWLGKLLVIESNFDLIT